MYVKDIMKITGERYQTIINDIGSIDSKFVPQGGPQATVDMNLSKKVCQKYGISFVDNPDGTLNLFRNVDNNETIYVPQNPARNVTKSNPNQRALDEYNSFEAEEVDPLNITAKMNQLSGDVNAILKLLDNKHRTRKKTILRDSMIHDMKYLTNLFCDYSYLVVPVNVAKKIRLKIYPLFLQNYVTDNFNNKLIAFNDKEVLYAYIINV